MNSVATYKNALSNIIYEHNGLENLVSSKWKELVPLITDDVLIDAHSSYDKYETVFRYSDIKHYNTKPETIFWYSDIHGESRPLKTMKRIKIKAQTERADVPFKVNSDLCAVRFPTYDIYRIRHIMKEIRQRVIDEEGIFVIRNSIEDDNGVMKDIIQYAFAYIPSIGYVIEIQVGHPFAMYTFKIDSKIRDMKLDGKPVDDIVDLWDNGFYDFVKSSIMNYSTCAKMTIDDFINVYPKKEALRNDKDLMSIIQKILFCNLL
jgi:hypothetical protein